MNRLAWQTLESSAVPISTFAIVLLLTIVFPFWAQYRSLRKSEPERPTEWITISRWNRSIALCMLAAWCVLWDWKADAVLLPAIDRHLTNISLFLAPFILFLLPSIAVRAISLLALYTIARAILGHRWTLIDIIRMTWWGTLSPLIAILFVVIGFHEFYNGSLLGFLWLIVAAICHLAGTFGLRGAEGFKPRKIKSGELYKRTLVLAKQMNMPLKSVSIIPSGRGHLTNAHGGGNEIFVTDNYGKFLVGAELDSLIVHELAHSKERHGRKLQVIMLSVYAAMALIALLIPAEPLARLRAICDVCVVLAPTLIYCAISRRFEYAADAAEIEFARQPAASIRSLGKLYGANNVPVDCPWLLELFMTHPSFSRRAQRMGTLGHLQDERIRELIQDARPVRLTSV
jgi:Zn-dependent protease with chaperone function